MPSGQLCASIVQNRRCEKLDVFPLQTDTPLAEKITSSQSALKASKGMHPLKRIGTADQVAAVAELLLDPANDNITGTMICVDGGLANIQAQGTST
jgi:3-oxoacyl-[acyl-carrier protein] reductase